MKKNKISNKNGQEGTTYESHNAAPTREGVSSDVFTDPRQQRERRIRRQLDLVPDIGCRRRQRRRNRAYTNDEDWWTKRSYNDGE
jgi:hypothetical protein